MTALFLALALIAETHDGTKLICEYEQGYTTTAAFACPLTYKGN